MSEPTMKIRRKRNAKYAGLAAMTLGTCSALGLGCIQAIFASIGATFF